MVAVLASDRDASGERGRNLLYATIIHIPLGSLMGEPSEQQHETPAETGDSERPGQDSSELPAGATNGAFDLELTDDPLEQTFPTPDPEILAARHAVAEAAFAVRHAAKPKGTVVTPDARDAEAARSEDPDQHAPPVISAVPPRRKRQQIS